jgi:hypothetical protein
MWQVDLAAAQQLLKTSFFEVKFLCNYGLRGALLSALPDNARIRELQACNSYTVFLLYLQSFSILGIFLSDDPMILINIVPCITVSNIKLSKNNKNCTILFLWPFLKIPPQSCSTEKISSFYIFWQSRVCWPLLCICCPFCIFERCLDLNVPT